MLAILVTGQFILRRIVSEPRLGHARPRGTPILRLLLIFSLVMSALTLGLVALTLFSPSDGADAVNNVVAGAATSWS